MRLYKSMGRYRILFYREFVARGHVYYPPFQIVENVWKIKNMFPERDEWDCYRLDDQTMEFRYEEDAILCYMRFA